MDMRVFRKWRFDFIRENAIGRYALYALGEVLLIVVGILAALWIDNWNQEQREAQTEQFYLEGLRTEFHTSLAKLDTLIAVNRKTFDSSRQLLNRIPLSATQEEEAALSALLLDALSYEIAYNPNNSLLDEMLNSGRLPILSDPDLRKHLTSWEAFLESVRRQENTLRMMREAATEALLTSGGRVLAMMEDVGMAERYVDSNRKIPEHDNLSALRSLPFENRLVLFMVTAESMEVNHYLPLREEVLVILKQIDAGLER